MKTFKDIDTSLCNYCGTCAAYCPTGAISFKNEKAVLTGKCNECGRCHAVCPGIGVDFHYLQPKAGKWSQPLGKWRSLWAAQSPKLKGKASSGGALTELLRLMLKRKMVNGVVVVKMDEANPIRPKAFIARTEKDLLAAMQSKYAMLPLNLALKETEGQKGKFAFVGLPCHVHGLRKVQRLGLAQNISMVFGVFCGVNMRLAATEFLVKKMGLKPAEVKEVKYREGKWPGKLKASDGKKSGSLPKMAYNFAIPLYAHPRCLLCPDLTNELADISFGDYWLKPEHTMVVCRNKKAELLLDSALKKNHLTGHRIAEEEFMRSHGHLVKYKKRGVFVRMKMSGSKPSFTLSQPEMGFGERLRHATFFILVKTASLRPVRFMLGLLPLGFSSRMAAHYRRMKTNA